MLDHAWLTALGRVLFPPYRRCSLCEVALDTDLDDGLCQSCLTAMPWIEANFCPRCGLPGVTASTRCPDCHEIPQSFSINRSLWSYQGEARRALHLFKFQKRVHLAHVFAEYMAKKFFCNYSGAYDIISYVPMHPQAQRMRGYNQSQLLAQELSKHLNLPCRVLLSKKALPIAQHQLGREARWQSLRGAVFTLQPGIKPCGRILLIDDIFTTGATAHFCSLPLLEAGAAEVAMLSVAR